MDLRESRNLTHQMVHDLGVAVISGKYSNETGLPSEAALCEQYKLSRTATREAVKMLTAKGLISSRPRQGISVSPESQWNLFDADLLQWIMLSRPSTKLLHEFTEMRIAFEPEAAGLAAQRRSEGCISHIEHALTRMSQAEKGFDDPLDSDIAFHAAVLTASQNRFFIQLKTFVSTALGVSIQLTNRVKGVPGGDVEAHARVLEAIKKGDVDVARHEMREMLIEVSSLISKAEQLKTAPLDKTS